MSENSNHGNMVELERAACKLANALQQYTKKLKKSKTEVVDRYKDDNEWVELEFWRHNV